MSNITEQQKLEGFLIAVNSFAEASERWNERSRKGLSDKQLQEALAYELGIYGGSCGPNDLSVSYQGAGLKIWITEDIHNPYDISPALQGNQTIRFARDTYNIKDPSDNQMSLF